MNNEYNEDLLAELASLNALALTALKGIAMAQADPQTYLANILDGGIAKLEETNFYSIPENRRDVIKEKAKARFTDSISSIML